MELPVTLQAAEFAASMLLGLALGVFYDALRALRRLRARLTLPLDVLFALTLAAALLLFALYPGRGLFRLFAFAALALGAGLYFLTLSAHTRIFSTFWESFCVSSPPLCDFFCDLGRKFSKPSLQASKNGLQYSV